MRDLRTPPSTPPVPSHARSRAVLVAAVLLGALALAFVAWGGPRAESTDARADRIAAGLRCPVCADLSAADSPAPIARQMRLQIRRQVERGVPAETIRERFVDAYGPGVLLTPPDSGWGRVARLAPLGVVGVAVLSGAVVVARALRRRPADQPPLSPDEREVVQRALADLIRGAG